MLDNTYNWIVMCQVDQIMNHLLNVLPPHHLSSDSKNGSSKNKCWQCIPPAAADSNKSKPSEAFSAYFLPTLHFFEQTMNIPLSSRALDLLIKHTDTDNDGEISLT